MTLSEIKNVKKDRGFTIVELLIVIVVIGILAAIVIVAYNGVTNRANSTKAQTNASAVQKVAEAFNADKGYYPGYLSDFSDATVTTKLPTGVTVGIATPVATTATTYVQYEPLGTSAAATGGRISFWDAAKTGGAGVSSTIIYVGAATATSTPYLTTLPATRP
jgi:prepilin-type N-terminal cleavage/methylation domain-containing protein